MIFMIFTIFEFKRFINTMYTLLTFSYIWDGAKADAEQTFKARHGAVGLLSKLAHLVRHVDAKASLVMLAQTNLAPRRLSLITLEYDDNIGVRTRNTLSKSKQKQNTHSLS